VRSVLLHIYEGVVGSCMVSRVDAVQSGFGGSDERAVCVDDESKLISA
jgi:hypothetical protein